MMQFKESVVGRFNLIFFTGALFLEIAMVGFLPAAAQRPRPVSVKTEIRNTDKGISFKSQEMIAQNFHQVNTGVRGHELFF